MFSYIFLESSARASSTFYKVSRRTPGKTKVSEYHSNLYCRSINVKLRQSLNYYNKGRNGRRPKYSICKTIILCDFN